MTDILNEEDYKTILKNYTKHDVEFVGGKQVPLSENCEGFTGDYFILELVFLEDGQEKRGKFFVKTVTTHTNLQGKIAAKRLIYEKEIFFYDFLLKQYEQFGLDISFAPSIYLCKNNTLVMENLATNQYILSEKNKLYDLEQTKLGLKALALYHTASIIYEEKMSEKLGQTFRLAEKYPELFKENYLDPNDPYFGKLILEKTFKSLKYFLETYKNKNSTNYMNPETALNGLFGSTSSRKATGHGDLWYNNIFFKYNNSKPENCKIIDHQLLRYSLPALDVLLFIHLNTSKGFRTTHMTDLLLFYHQTMSEIFQEHGYDVSKILPLEEFEETLNFIETSAMFSVFSIGTLVFMPADIMKEFYDAFGENFDDTFFDFVVKAMETKPEYKKMVLDALDDYCDSLGRNNNKMYFKLL